MALPVNTIADTCALIGRQIKDRFKNLSLHFIIHREGRRAEALGMAGPEVVDHPAAETAMHLLTNAQQAEESALIGVAVAREHLFGGLATRDSLLALCSINSDQYENIRDARAHAYHMAWHALDAYQFHSDPANRTGHPREIIIRKRNSLEMAGANLQGDVFSAIMGGQQGERDGIKRLGTLRGMAVLQAHYGQNPERYPFLLALEAAGVAMDHLRQHPVAKRKYIDAALRAARQIGRTFDDDSVLQWLAFSEPAQDMAWRGATPAEILGTAIGTSENVHVRATGHLVAEATGIKPANIAEIAGIYSPFADDHFNQRLHDKAIEDCFRDVIAEGLRRHSADPFIEAANRQNMKLLDGQVLGWCAGALQVSGRAFSQALESGREPEGAARREFDGERGRTPWSSLRDLGKKIIDSYRQGRGVTLRNLSDVNKDDRHLAAVRKSLDLTLKDPSIKPEAAASVHAGPVTPALAPSAPAATRAPAFLAGGPGMGPGGGARTRAPAKVAVPLAARDLPADDGEERT